MDMNFTIKDLPEKAKHYKYIIAMPSDDIGDYEFFGGTDDPKDAATIAAATQGGIIIHNTNYEPPKEKYYSFTGTWSAGVYATSQEEAIRLFCEMYPEDYDFSDYDNIYEYDE